MYVYICIRHLNIENKTLKMQNCILNLEKRLNIIETYALES